MIRSITNVLVCRILHKLSFENGVALKTNQDSRLNLIVNTFILTDKQLLDEVEHDIMNYQNRGLGYLPKPKAEANN